MVMPRSTPDGSSEFVRLVRLSTTGANHVNHVNHDRSAGLLAEVAASLASELSGELLDEAGAILAAEQARMCWIDRLADGATAQLLTLGNLTLRGQVALSGPDAITLRLDPSQQRPGAEWAIVPAAAVLRAQGLPTRLPQETRRPVLRWSMGQMLRQYLGWPSQVYLRDGSTIAGHLRHVGADHLDLIPAQSAPEEADRVGAATVLPFVALSTVLV